MSMQDVNVQFLYYTQHWHDWLWNSDTTLLTLISMKIKQAVKMQRGELLSAVGGDLLTNQKTKISQVISHLFGENPDCFEFSAFSLFILQKLNLRGDSSTEIIFISNNIFFYLFPFDISSFRALIGWVKNEQGHAAGQFHIAFKNKDVSLSNFPPQVRKENLSIDTRRYS